MVVLVVATKILVLLVDRVEVVVTHLVQQYILVDLLVEMHIQEDWMYHLLQMVLDTLEDLDNTFLGNGKEEAAVVVPAVLDSLDLMLDRLDMVLVEVVPVV